MQSQLIQSWLIKELSSFQPRLTDCMLKEGFSAEWAGGLVAGSEPFVQTC